MKVIKSHKNFRGQVRFWEHDSAATKTKMKFSTFTPEGPLNGALIWLSGLTCTEENFITKACAQKYLADAGLMVICPDTSPRGLQLPQEHEADDFGSGAGFYLNATTPGYDQHYKMYDYITHDIFSILQNDFAVGDKISILGHSMGGHGALVIGLREPTKFKSVSAFSPIVNPTQVPWGKKAFLGYLGQNEKAWNEYDACELIKTGNFHPAGILIDQGTQDGFLDKQLRPENFVSACRISGKQKVELRMQDGYDHSYYFISSFIQSHIEFHAKHLMAT